MKEYFEKFGHTCELKVDDELGSLLKDQPRWKRALIKWMKIDPTSSLTLQHFSSHSSIVEARKFHLASHRVTIHPFSRFKWAWECFMMFVFLWGLIYGPLHYLDYVDSDEATNVGNLLILTLVKVLCIVDMAARFITGFVNKEFAVSSKNNS